MVVYHCLSGILSMGVLSLRFEYGKKSSGFSAVRCSFGLELAIDGTGISTLSFSIGDSIFLIDLSNPVNKRFVTVAGFLEQSSYLFSPYG